MVLKKQLGIGEAVHGSTQQESVPLAQKFYLNDRCCSGKHKRIAWAVFV